MSEPVRGKRLIQVRIDADVMKAVDHLKIDWGVSRAEAVERLLREALRNPPPSVMDQTAEIAAEVQRGLQPLGSAGHKRMTL